MRLETYQHLVDILETSNTPMSTQEIATKIQLSRSVTSLYLNKLLEKGEVQQTGKKPVYWQLTRATTPTTDVFRQYIGSQGSAKKAIEQCKAAMLYPPLGMPLLIHGASGVGKSFLAKLIYEYLKNEQIIGLEKFYTFNCADYANNPELLSSILFGHTKGAFTGAESEKQGLLAQANNSVLFLDEVHRLSNENQEKLFQFMDTGTFRPIGEEGKMVHSKVRLLFATTENPKKVLLPTFYRRISVIVSLPNFKERPIRERIAILKNLFHREAKRMTKDINVDEEIFTALLENDEPGNVGSLSNKVQLLCASQLRKTLPNQPVVIGDATQPMIAIPLDKEVLEEDTLSSDIFATFEALFTKEKTLAHLKTELTQFIKYCLDDEITLENDYFLQNLVTEVQTKNKLIINQPEQTEKPMKDVAKLLKILPPTFNETVLLPVQTQLKEHYPRTVSLVKNLVSPLPEEYRFLTEVLLSVLLSGEISETIPYQALLVAHGESTATSSIQAVANKLCGTYIFDAINMPLTSSVRDIVAEVKEWLSQRDTSQGVIMLVDMGSLTQLYKSLKPQILGELLVINNLTTAYALEIGHQLMNEQLFYGIAKTAEKKFKTDVQYFEGFSVEKNIIVSSISGLDIAKQIKQICQKYLYTDIKVITLKYKDLVNTLDIANAEENYLKETSLILTTSYLDNHTNVASVNLLDMLDEDAGTQLMEPFQNLMHPNNIDSMINEFVHFFSKEGLSEKLEFLNPDVIIKQVENVTKNIEKRFDLTLSGKMKFNLMMHNALMVERTMLGVEDYEIPANLEELTINQKPFFQNAKNIFYTLEQFYRIEISNWELYVIYEILSSR
ncbi:sigma 54-interacting transcriptional regulator [Enterococcus faecalis]|nr:sigma 54-interacting transcriptional regulator [Enterococcus faecalis]